MPLHEWRCQGCKKEVEVIRSFSEHDKQPEEKCDCPEGTDPQWQKFLSRPPQGAYGAGWGGGKGNWVLLLAGLPILIKLVEVL